MMYLHALSPVHTGTGQGVDVIDLPVAREKTTNWPVIPGSSIKGVLRAACEGGGVQGGKGSLLWAVFGPDTANAGDGAGSLLFADGRLLCLPVRSLYGTFAWVTCPLALARYQRDHAAAQIAVPPVPAHLDVAEDGAIVTDASRVTHDGTVFLEDLDLPVIAGPRIDAVAEHIAAGVFTDATWRQHFQGRFTVVSDTTFTFLAETATVVSARISIDAATKTAAHGALWYEEAIPAESIFSAPLLATPRGDVSSDDLYGLVVNHLKEIVQIGGNASVGRGLMRVCLQGGRA